MNSHVPQFFTKPAILTDEGRVDPHPVWLFVKPDRLFRLSRHEAVDFVVRFFDGKDLEPDLSAKVVENRNPSDGLTLVVELGRSLEFAHIEWRPLAEGGQG
jgi:hypothetical protein